VETFAADSVQGTQKSGKSLFKHKPGTPVDDSMRPAQSAAENTEPENDLKTKVAEMTSMYFEFKKKSAEVKKLEDDGETTSGAILLPVVSASEGGVHTEPVGSMIGHPSPGEPTSEGASASTPGVAASVSGATTAYIAGTQATVNLRMNVVKKKEELLAAERAIFEQERNDAVDQRMAALKKKEEMFAAERAAFEMEKNILAKERHAITDERMTQILELEELLATERARFLKEKEAMEKEKLELLEKEREDFQKEREEKQEELESLSSEKEGLARQVEIEKQKNEDFQRVLDILSKQLENDGIVQLATDDRLLKLAGLTDSHSELITDDTMFLEDEEEDLDSPSGNAEASKWTGAGAFLAN
jgi:hypothetical protein